MKLLKFMGLCGILTCFVILASCCSPNLGIMSFIYSAVHVIGAIGDEYGKDEFDD